jgi:hypothetical protein
MQDPFYWASGVTVATLVLEASAEMRESSSLSLPTTIHKYLFNGASSTVVVASALHAECRGFESLLAYHLLVVCLSKAIEHWIVT